MRYMIKAAVDGGYYIRRSNSGTQRVEDGVLCFAGTLDQCLRYLKAQFKEQEEA